MKEDTREELISWMQAMGMIIGIALVIGMTISGVHYLYKKPPQTYDQCMMSKMKSRPSSMHEIVSEYCKREVE